jgi:hypothetical protein
MAEQGSLYHLYSKNPFSADLPTIMQWEEKYMHLLECIS